MEVAHPSCRFSFYDDIADLNYACLVVLLAYTDLHEVTMYAG